MIIHTRTAFKNAVEGLPSALSCGSFRGNLPIWKSKTRTHFACQHVFWFVSAFTSLRTLNLPNIIGIIISIVATNFIKCSKSAATWGTKSGNLLPLLYNPKIFITTQTPKRHKNPPPNLWCYNSRLECEMQRRSWSGLFAEALELATRTSEDRRCSLPALGITIASLCPS